MTDFLSELFGFVSFVWGLPILYGLTVGGMMFCFVVISLIVWLMGLSFKDDVHSSIRQSHRERDRIEKQKMAREKREKQKGAKG